MLLDLDTQGVPSSDALDLLAKLRGMNQDLIVIALTRNHDHELRLKAAKVAETQNRLTQMLASHTVFLLRCCIY